MLIADWLLVIGLAIGYWLLAYRRIGILAYRRIGVTQEWE